jgi:hypothetical protein
VPVGKPQDSGSTPGPPARQDDGSGGKPGTTVTDNDAPRPTPVPAQDKATCNYEKKEKPGEKLSQTAKLWAKDGQEAFIADEKDIDALSFSDKWGLFPVANITRVKKEDGTVELSVETTVESLPCIGPPFVLRNGPERWRFGIREGELSNERSIYFQHNPNVCKCVKGTDAWLDVAVDAKLQLEGDVKIEDLIGISTCNVDARIEGHLWTTQVYQDVDETKTITVKQNEKTAAPEIEIQGKLKLTEKGLEGEASAEGKVKVELFKPAKIDRPSGYILQRGMGRIRDDGRLACRSTVSLKFDVDDYKVTAALRAKPGPFELEKRKECHPNGCPAEPPLPPKRHNTLDEKEVKK